jgi:hypothetical protein
MKIDSNCGLLKRPRKRMEKGRGYFKHLDKCNTEIHVRLVPADERQAEEKADWNNGAEVDATSHFHSFAAIKEGRGSREDLRHEGCEGEMPCCEDDC